MLALIASVVAPIGGIIASGYKRAFKVKHFSNLLPGHGEVSDRVDCQLIMQLAANLYFQNIARKRTVEVFKEEIINNLTPRETLNLVEQLLKNYKHQKKNY